MTSRSLVALETTALSKRFGGIVATDNVTFTLERGARQALIGPNGAGKTTFFNLLAGNLAPDSGAVLLEGRDVTRLDATQRARAGISRSFQRNNLFPDLPVRDHLALACALRIGATTNFWRPMKGLKKIAAEAADVAAKVGLTENLDIPVRALSYGSQRQLEVALALALRPRVLLLDEPTSGMSPQETALMHDLIVSLPRTLTIIVIEHDMDIVLDVADEIVVLDYGRVLEKGSPKDIQASSIVRERYLGEDFGKGGAA